VQKVSCYKVVAVYVGTVIGAGFASGQEILQFFVLHGMPGVLGTLIAGLMFAWFGTVILLLSLKFRAGSYLDILIPVMGKKLTTFFDGLNLLILTGGASVMLAGSGAIFEEYFNLPAVTGIFITVLITLPVIMSGLAGMIIANSIIVPVKLSVVILVIIAATVLKHNIEFPFFSHFLFEGEISGSWFFSLILYVSYNMVIPLAALSSVGKYLDKKTAVKSGVLGGLGLGIAALIVALGELNFYPEIKYYQIPLLYIASQIHPLLRTTISFVIWVAILTTLIGNIHGVASRIAPQGGIFYRIVGTLILIISLPLTFFDFSTLVGILYPLFGYAGLMLLLALFFSQFKIRL